MRRRAGRSAGSRAPNRASCRRPGADLAPRRPPPAPRSRCRRSARGRSADRPPSSSSGRSGDEPTRAGWTFTGRRLAKRPRPPRSANRACSGRTVADGSDHFGSADGAEQDRVGGATGFDVLRSDRDAVRVDGDAAGEDLGPLDREAEPSPGRVDDPPGSVDHLGPDPVSRDRGDPVGKATARHGRPSLGALARERDVDAVDLARRGACWPPRGRRRATPR